VDSQVSALRTFRPIRQRNQLYAAKLLNRRAQLFDQEKVLDEIAIDRYLFIRDAYLTRREHLVYDGHPPKSAEEDEDDFDDMPENASPAAPGAPPPATAPENTLPAEPASPATPAP
jgi:phospholipid-binding lipoprotein MlaA